MIVRYICKYCRWIYGEENGEFGSDVDPSTPFDEPPEGFEFPEYYADKGKFCAPDD